MGLQADDDGKIAFRDGMVPNRLAHLAEGSFVDKSAAVKHARLNTERRRKATLRFFPISFGIPEYAVVQSPKAYFEHRALPKTQAPFAIVAVARILEMLCVVLHVNINTSAAS